MRGCAVLLVISTVVWQKTGPEFSAAQQPQKTIDNGTHTT
ncbi:MAG: hypothetical protein ACI8V5_004045 [Limisphaerales bacterium]